MRCLSLTRYATSIGLAVVLLVCGRCGGAEESDPEASALQQAETAGFERVEDEVAAATQAQAERLEPAMDSAGAALQQALAGGIEETRDAVHHEQQRELAVVRGMRDAIEQARAQSLAEVDRTAASWVGLQARLDADRILSPVYQRALAAESSAEGIRGTSTDVVRHASTVATEMVELAREASDVAHALHHAQVEGNARSLLERDRLLQAQAQQARGLSDLAGRAVHDAAILAARSLDRAQAAEVAAAQALATARNNAVRVSNLKARAQTILQQAVAVQTAV